MWLVTGGAGFIGSHLAHRLVTNGERVRVFDNLSTGHIDRLEEITGDIEFIEGDVRSEAAVQRAMAGVEVVLHQAAQASVPLSVMDPISTYAVNTSGTLNVLHAARQAGVRRVVLASTSAVYGNNPVSPKAESLPPAPVSPYASSKLATESMGEVFTAAYLSNASCCAISMSTDRGRIQIRPTRQLFPASSIE